MSEEEKLLVMREVARQVMRKARLILRKKDLQECRQLLKQICGMTSEYMT